MTREVKIGTAVAGSFLSLVGIVVGTKMYQGEIPTPPNPDQIADVGKTNDPPKSKDAKKEPPLLPVSAKENANDLKPSFEGLPRSTTPSDNGLPPLPPPFQPINSFTPLPSPSPGNNLPPIPNSDPLAAFNDPNNPINKALEDGKKELERNQRQFEQNNKGVANTGISAFEDARKNLERKSNDFQKGFNDPKNFPGFPEPNKNEPPFEIAQGPIISSGGKKSNPASESPALPAPKPINNPLAVPENPKPIVDSGKTLPNFPDFKPGKEANPPPKFEELPPPTFNPSPAPNPGVPNKGPASKESPPAIPAAPYPTAPLPQPNPGIQTQNIPIVTPKSIDPMPFNSAAPGNTNSPPVQFGPLPGPPNNTAPPPIPPNNPFGPASPNPAPGFVPAPIPGPPPFDPARSNPQAQPTAPIVKMDNPERYICEANEAYALISRRKYGTDSLALALEEYNRRLPGAADNVRAQPARLTPGTTVWLPSQNVLLEIARAAPESNLPPITSVGNPRPVGNDLSVSPPVPGNALPPRPTGADAGVVNYTVPMDGLLLAQIAERQLGSALRWIEIYRLNNTLQPEQPLRAGTVLRVPAK
jgi:hypothetical protein